MEKPTIESIHKVMDKLGMMVFKAPFSVTLGGVRTNDNKANTFNDWLFASYWDDKGKLHSVVLSGTTDAGFTYRLKPMNKNGTAIIQHDVQHRGVYQYQNPPVNNPQLKRDKKPIQLGHNGKEAFRQIKDMKYWRDNNKDEVLDFYGKEEISNSSTNGHNMGTLGKDVNNWSAGCWGSVEKNMAILYNIAKIQISKGLGDIFSFAMLHEKSFK